MHATPDCTPECSRNLVQQRIDDLFADLALLWSSFWLPKVLVLLLNPQGHLAKGETYEMGVPNSPGILTKTIKNAVFLMANELLSCSLSKKTTAMSLWPSQRIQRLSIRISIAYPSSVPASYVAECPSRSTETPPSHRRRGGGRSCWTRGPRRPCPAGCFGGIPNP